MLLQLSDREQKILENIIHNYILTANPIGSRLLAKKTDLGLSPATIRNVMVDLEEQGLIEQPHTSAGRVPTDTGYRWYVDNLMRIEKLSPKEKQKIKEHVTVIEDKNVETVLQKTSHTLAKLTNQLAVVLSPEISEGLLKKIEVLKVSERYVLVVISIVSGPIRTITLELKSEVRQSQVNLLNSILNERLTGLKLVDIKSSISERMRDIADLDDSLVRIFIDSAEQLFDSDSDDRFHFEGALDLVDQPEFMKTGGMRTIIELLEEKKIIIHLFKNNFDQNGIQIKIGGENANEMIKPFSVITSVYRYGDVSGKLGVIGPTRMHYPRVVTLVDYTSRLLSKILSSDL